MAGGCVGVCTGPLTITWRVFSFSGCRVEAKREILCYTFTRTPGHKEIGVEPLNRERLLLSLVKVFVSW